MNEQDTKSKLSDKLAELSVAAKNAESAVAKAKQQTSDKIQQMSEDARNNVERRIASFNAAVTAAQSGTASRLDAWKAKAKADAAAVKARVEQKKHDIDVKSKERYADALEDDAAYATEYAICCIEDAQASILDAISARVAAEATK